MVSGLPVAAGAALLAGAAAPPLDVAALGAGGAAALLDAAAVAAPLGVGVLEDFVDELHAVRVATDAATNSADHR